MEKFAVTYQVRGDDEKGNLIINVSNGIFPKTTL